MEFAFPAKRETAARNRADDSYQRRSFFMFEIKQMLMVGLGGGLGSIARYKLGGFVLHRTGAWDFPWSTFTVNVLGCFVIGVLAALVERHDFFSNTTRIFLFTGLLGGFTTYSAFAYEGTFLIRKGLFNLAALYAFTTLLAGFAAVWIGFYLVNSLWRAQH
jgi:CrcB protein